MCLSLTDAYFGLICLFPIATTLGIGIVNKILFLLMLVLHLCMFFSHPIKKGTFLAMVVMSINYIWTLSQTDTPLENHNLLAYFPFFFLYTYYIWNNRQRVLGWFSAHRRYLLGIIRIWCALVLFSALLPGSYQIREGGGRYFGSFCRDIFRLGPSAAFIQVLVVLRMILHGKRQAFFYMTVPMLCYLMGSSRTYLVIGFLLFLIGWYLYCPRQRWFWASVLPLCAALLLLISRSALGGKIAYTLDDSQYGDFWYRITSSRTALWSRYLKAWKETPLLQKLLGNHLEFTLHTAGRWAHNDFLEILCSFGLLGLGQYLWAIHFQFRQAWAACQVPLVLRFGAGMVWLFNAMFNMHYVYFCAMLAYPLLLLALGEKFRRKDQ